jgi:hypothetical protein
MESILYYLDMLLFTNQNCSLAYWFQTEHLMLSLSACTNDDSDSTDAIKEEASLLLNEEMEQRLLSIVEDSLEASFSVKSVCYTQTYCSFSEKQYISLHYQIVIHLLAAVPTFFVHADGYLKAFNYDQILLHYTLNSQVSGNSLLPVHCYGTLN